MKTHTAEKTRYSLIKTLILISQIDIISKVIQDKFKLNINQLISNFKMDLLNDEIKEYILGVYENVIVNSEDYYNRYCDIEIPDNLSSIDIKGKTNTPRRLTKKYLLDKKDKEGLTENERLVLYSIDMKQLSTRIHNMGKDGKASDEECREIIGAVQLIQRKCDKILKKNYRKKV